MTVSMRGVAVVLALTPLVALGPAAGAEHGTPGTAQLASRATGSAPVPAASTNHSFLGENIDSSGLNAAGRTVSADGNRVVFASDADGLSPADDNRYRNIFVRDRSAQTTTLVSRAGGLSGDAANDDSFEPTISADGTVVAFTTRASNLGDNAPANSNNKVYVRTIATGATRLVSRATGAGGAVAAFLTGEPSLDAAGAKVAFATFSTLDAADTGTFDRDVYVRDVAGDTTTFVSRADGVSGAEGDGESRAPSISGDGSRVAFDSASTNLVSGDANGKRDVFVRDLVAGTTVIASRATGSGGALGNQDSVYPSLTGDGTKVAFSSSATNLDTDATGGVNVFVRDLPGSTTTLASRKDGVAGAQANVSNLFQPAAISGDGSAVAFVAGGTGIAPGPTPTWFSVYVRDLGTGATRMASRPDGTGTNVVPDGLSQAPSLNGDGDLTVFDSLAGNLGTDADPAFRGIYLRDLATDATKSLVRPGPDAEPFESSGLDASDSSPAGVSADGRYVLFTSKADWVSSEDDDGVSNVFVRDIVTDTTTLVSRASGAGGAPSNGDSVAGGISADGTKVVFVSASTNLNPPHATAEVYVRNLVTSQTVQVSPPDSNAAGAEVLDGVSRARISANGSKVVFETVGALDPQDSGFGQDAYVANADGSGTPVWVNRSTAGTPGNGESLASGIDADGSRVAFESTSSNLDPDDPNSGPDVYVRDLAASQTILVSRANGAGGAVGDSESRGGGISADGSRVAFSSFASNLVSGVLNTGQIYVRDLAAGTTLLVSRDDGPSGVETAGNPQPQPAISADGQRVAFSHTGSINGISNPGFPTQVYVRNLATNLTTLVSHATGAPSTAANRSAQHPAISANGDCVAFQSAASDLVPAFPGGSDFPNVYLGTVARECPAVVPGTTLTGGPAGTISTRSPVFTFTSDDGGATFECRLDAGAFAACASPFTAASLGDGAHAFAVRAVDAAGYRDASPASRSFAVDATAPQTSIGSGPSGPVASRSATFTFGASEAARFTCSLDGGTRVACSSPVSYTGLADGVHAFGVVATDAVGLVDATPASRTWTVDATAPNTSVRVPGQRLARAIAKGIRLRLAVNEAASYTLTLVYKGRACGTGRASLARAGQRLVVLKASGRGKKALRKVRKASLTVRLTAKDALGNARKLSKRFTLRR
jgi:hypothetical protein